MPLDQQIKDNHGEREPGAEIRPPQCITWSCDRYTLIGFAALDESAAVTVGTKHGNAYYGALPPKKASALHA
jgi:hypothetical protein